jgi:hypothetical protein
VVRAPALTRTRTSRLPWRNRLPSRAASGIVLALGVPYTILNVVYPGPLLTYTLGLLLALLALGALWLGGLSLGDCRLRLVRPSWRGLLLLLALCIFIPGAFLAGRVQQQDVPAAMLAAVTSAFAQELYFRAALLTALERLRPAHPSRMVLLQAGIFAVWHARAFRVVTPAPASGVLLLAFVAGAAWGWQVRHDRTLAYAVLQHACFLFIQ